MDGWRRCRLGLSRDSIQAFADTPQGAGQPCDHLSQIMFLGRNLTEAIRARDVKQREVLTHFASHAVLHSP
jgi:hypothetical protein